MQVCSRVSHALTFLRWKSAVFFSLETPTDVHKDMKCIHRLKKSLSLACGFITLSKQLALI